MIHEYRMAGALEHNRDMARFTYVLPLLFYCCGCFGQSLTITGVGIETVVLSAKDLAAMEHISAAYFDAGKTTTYRGVAVESILKKAGVLMNQPHGGKPLHMCILAMASDGYRVVYALAEFDSAIRKQQPIVADESEGKPLGEKVGPLRLVMPDEKKGARSVRMLEKLELVDLTAGK